MNGNVVRLKDYRPGTTDETGQREQPKVRRWPTIGRAIGKGIRLIFRVLGKVAKFVLFFTMATLRGPIKIALASIALLGLVGGPGIILAVPEMRVDQQLLVAFVMVIGAAAFLAWYWYDLFLCWIDPVLQKYMRG